MVIFESHRAMLSTSGSSYINPEYLRPLSPLPSELDAKASPLALLAKTCSQIGADPSFPNGISVGKTTGSQSAKRPDGGSKDSTKSVSPYTSVRSESRELYDRQDSRSRSGSVEIKVTDQIAQREETKTRSSLSSNVSSMSAKSPHPVVTLHSENEDNPDEEEPERKRAKTATPQRTSAVTPVTASDTKSNQKVSAPHQSPIIRSGLEVLSGNGSLGTSGTSSSAARDLLLANYRPPFPPSLSYPGFPGSSGTYASPLTTNPFWASFMSSTAGVCRDPLCADPFCPTSLRNQQLFAAATGRMPASSALSNYSTLLNAAAAAQHREALLAAQRSVAMAAAASVTGNPSTGPNSTGGLKPYVCSWVAGSDYCGRRFSSSEELLVHLKTHTNITSTEPRAALLPVVTSGSTSPTSSSLSASARFHPYARPLAASMPSSLTSLGLGQGYPLSYASLYPSLFPRPPLL